VKLLLDGDILVYRCGFSVEHTKHLVFDASADEGDPPIAGPFDSAKERNEWMKENLGDQEIQLGSYKDIEPLSNALGNVKTVMNAITGYLGSDDIQVFLSEGECFRHHLATIKPYKGNRDLAAKPRYYDDIRQYLIKTWGAHVCSSIEADDALAMRQTKDTCIVSIDKDLLQVPGKHYNWVIGGNDGKCYVSPEVGLRKLYQQVLTGDSTDNIPGIRGVGPVTARKLLADVPATKKDLSAACTAAWDKYLSSDAGEGDGFYKLEEEEGRYWYYPHWHHDGDMEFKIESDAETIAAEVFALVEVGGMNAKEALKENSEVLPPA